MFCAKIDNVMHTTATIILTVNNIQRIENGESCTNPKIFIENLDVVTFYFLLTDNKKASFVNEKHYQ